MDSAISRFVRPSATRPRPGQLRIRVVHLGAAQPLQHPFGDPGVEQGLSRGHSPDGRYEIGAPDLLEHDRNHNGCVPRQPKPGRGPLTAGGRAGWNCRGPVARSSMATGLHKSRGGMVLEPATVERTGFRRADGGDRRALRRGEAAAPRHERGRWDDFVVARQLPEGRRQQPAVEPRAPGRPCKRREPWSWLPRPKSSKTSSPPPLGVPGGRRWAALWQRSATWTPWCGASGRPEWPRPIPLPSSGLPGWWWRSPGPSWELPSPPWCGRRDTRPPSDGAWRPSRGRFPLVEGQDGFPQARLGFTVVSMVAEVPSLTRGFGLHLNIRPGSRALSAGKTVVPQRFLASLFQGQAVRAADAGRRHHPGAP